jgi:hypothetical protein
MDPLSTASAFATIVGLLASFRAERKSTSDDEYKEFLSWLNEKRHNEIIHLLEQNNKTAISVKSFLSQDREVVLSKLRSLEEMLVYLSSQLEGVSEIALSLHPGCEISEQALNILKQLVDSGGSTFLVSEAMNRDPVLLLLDSDSRQIEYEDYRFLKDDLSILVELGLLRVDFNSNGNELYIITRNSVNYVKELEK